MLYDLLIFSCIFLISFTGKALLKRYLWIVPVSMITGFLAFVGSEEILGLYKFSDNFSFYIDIFLSFIFAGFPLSISSFNKGFFGKVKTLWQYSALQYLSQWGFSLLLTVTLLKAIFPFLTDQFGLILPVGFAGGHGSAAVAGDLLVKLNYKEGLSLAMTMATIGAMISLVGGTFWILWGKKKGLITNFNFSEQKSMQKYSFDLKVILIVTAIVSLGYIVKPLIISFLNFEVPIFVLSVILSGIVRLSKPKLNFDARAIETITNISTDLLVCIGIAGIKIIVIAKYSYPIFIMSIFGVLMCLFYFLRFGLKVFKEDSFAKTLFTWGWSTGGLVFGLALVKMVNKDNNMRVIEQFAFTYLMLAPIEISLLLSMPYLVTQGYGLYISMVLILLSGILIKLLSLKADKVLK